MRIIFIIILTSAYFCEPVFANPDAGSPFIRGITVSCRGNGRGEWNSPAMGKTIAQLKTLGATSFSIHPYARINNDGSLRFNQLGNDPMVLQPLADANT